MFFFFLYTHFNSFVTKTECLLFRPGSYVLWQFALSVNGGMDFKKFPFITFGNYHFIVIIDFIMMINLLQVLLTLPLLVLPILVETVTATHSNISILFNCYFIFNYVNRCSWITLNNGQGWCRNAFTYNDAQINGMFYFIYLYFSFY